ncbi:MAG: 50S ribosomal protein L21 [bacterium]|nr:50S ribosomal protein L21 [bacterium]
MFAIIETGGKQYMVSVNDKIKVEKLAGADGQEIVFDKVLLVAGEASVPKIGKPFVSGARVVGKILQQGRGDKIRMLKYHSKTRYRRRKGHRQDYTEIQINSIQ